ncbi:MAG: PRC-barrel domain containing protein [Alphaproteobacteria bacterium]|nr:PRC-barrel domain containing protein [Alphaproteobacteria bacterium]
MARHAYRRVLSADTLEDTPVYGTDGNKLGTIEEIMIDIEDGKVEYAVLEFHEGFMNMKEKLFAVPWNAMQIDEDQERIILNVPEDTLKSAPGFDKDDWPDMADPLFSSQINEYYGSYTASRI